MLKFDSGVRVYGVGIALIAALCAVLRCFYLVESTVPDFPGKPFVLLFAAATLFVAGVAVEYRKTALWGASVIVAYYVLLVVLGLNGRDFIEHWAEFGIYETVAVQLAIAAGALIICARTGGLEEKISARVANLLVKVGLRAFAICVVVFGVAHFVFLEYTAPLIPHWILPSQVFWAYATGAAQIAAGVAIFVGIRAQLAATLLTVMYALFSVLIHLPMLLHDSSNHFIWSENAVNIALIGAAWVVAATCAHVSIQQSKAQG